MLWSRSPRSKVLVSGANGFIGMWVVHSLLEKGYSVRAAVRSPDKGRHMKNHFQAHADRLELAIVPDIAKEGAFDEAVKGVEGIVHTASPVHLFAPSSTVEEFVEPAVKGTTGILRSAAKHGTSVKGIVTTASIASVLNIEKPEQRTYTEADWNEESEKILAEKGVKAGNGVMYSASKTLAERAAWNFYKENKDNISWTLTVLHPPMPPIQEVSSLESLNTSMLAFWHQLIPETKQFAPLPGAWVDVRDLADAHVLALEKEAAGGERIFVSAGPLVWQDWIDAANALGRNLTPAIPDPERKRVCDFSNAKEQKILGLKYRSINDTVKDCLEDFAIRGW
ncbi:D-lactaldehyde dehydrogenase [Coprinopsis sp. MPI-PUGE-AT-0042]|nr:D-lactaldehyde dehydrogenase [Coprinopsis sp. MPI-PUGE-AT-0042]